MFISWCITPPKVAVSRLVNSLKGVSSRHLRRRFPELERWYWKRMLWSPSYFAGSCGGAPISVIRQYIEHQKSPGGVASHPLPKGRGLPGDEG